MQPVIKWTGSKRYLIKKINEKVLKNFNWDDVENIYDPFFGGGSTRYFFPDNKKIFASDKFETLIKIWQEIQNDPEKMSMEYRKRWTSLQNEGEDVYYKIRERFNKTRNFYDFFFLTRTCENGLIRFNRKNEFNVAFHRTRYGINPETLEKILMTWNKKIKNVQFSCRDYADINCGKKDFLFLDPPYNTTQSFYINRSFDYTVFLVFLKKMNEIGTKWLLTYNEKIPQELYIKEYQFDAVSSYNRLKKIKKTVTEYVFTNF